MLAELLSSAQRITLDAALAAAAATSVAAGHGHESGEAAALCHANLDQFRSTVQRMQFSDLGLTCTIESLALSVLGSPNIRFFDVLDHASLSVSLIICPSGTRIPLHDHPGMHVFTKVLVGQLDIQMLDVEFSLPCAAVPVDTPVGVRNTRIVSLKAGEFCELTPVVGNIHGVTCSGSETAIMLDVMLPPYPSDDSCHYFRTTDSITELRVINEEHAWSFGDPSAATGGMGEASAASEASVVKSQAPKVKRASGKGARGGRKRF
jgi:hypothetical protein